MPLTIQDPGGYGMPDELTLRDYIAVHAMQGILAHQYADTAPFDPESIPIFASEAYRLSDAMLVASGKAQTEEQETSDE